MLGLVLEGGGAKGSYHAGAIKALYEKGIVPNGVMGTSIGAINGALVAQGDTEKCIDLWETLVPSSLVDVDDEKMLNFFNRKYDKETVKYLFKIIKDTLSNKGFSIDKTMQLLRTLIDEEKLRKTKTDFGLVTISVTDRMPMEIFKEEIPYGMLHDYVMASAYYPAFRNIPIDGKKYFDGGIYDNLPINPLIRRGYDEIIAVRTMSKMPHQSVIDDTVKVTYIIPSDNIGGTMSVYADSLANNMQMGYYDTIKVLNDYKGSKYYFQNIEQSAFNQYLYSFCDNTFDELKKLFELDEERSKEIVINKLLSTIRTQMKCGYILSDYEAFLIFLEKYGEQYDIERYCIYDINNYLTAIAEYEPKKGSRYRIIEYMKQTFKNNTMDILFDILINWENSKNE